MSVLHLFFSHVEIKRFLDLLKKQIVTNGFFIFKGQRFYDLSIPEGRYSPI